MKNRKRFSIILVLAFITLIGVILFYTAQKPIGNAEEKAETRAIDEGHLTEISRSYPVNGSEPSITVLGKNKDGKPAAVFVPDGTEGEMRSVLLKDGIGFRQALDVVREDMDVRKVLHVHLGNDESGPFWEVAFTGPDDKLNYVHLNFGDGKVRKKILNL
ncbi:Uncharacterized protein YpmB [Bhargavaea ginsengi]|uniref:Uncharacterized protein YpmB n=1 Tax=Bhargavaea ginsengi TaxID=426757 RepID=A0A1H6S8Q8_9BACL|nr:DUF5590 domain-containing protein [Bhargavaea ginsengi]SEI64269.1 Uncharacterized protein YpmB [Bhargavaea ginsengi]